LEFTDLFKEYLALFEETLESFIGREGSNIAEFYAQVRISSKHGGSGNGMWWWWW